jgi:hypothetical protein
LDDPVLDYALPLAAILALNIHAKVYPVIQMNPPGKCFAITLKHTKSLSLNTINLAISIWEKYNVREDL